MLSLIIAADVVVNSYTNSHAYQKVVLNTNADLFFDLFADIMPKSYLTSEPPPDVPVVNWLTWSASTLEASIADSSDKIAGVMGINKAGDIAHLIMPTIVPTALDDDSVIIGNSSDMNNEPSFIFMDTSDIGFVTVIEKYSDVPAEIRPEEPLPAKFFKSTSWEDATAELCIARFPMFAPILFGMSHVEASVHDDDFEDKIGAMLPKHAEWAKLVKEHFMQNENNGKCVDKIFDRVYKGRDRNNAKYVTDGSIGEKFSDSCIQFFNLPSTKWTEHQSSLRSFFKGNPSPIRLSRSVNFADTENQDPTNVTPAAFDPMSFMKLFTDQMIAIQQKSQTIVVESREDKTRETEAKFNNNMLQLLLIGGTVDFSSPGSFADPRVSKYTQAMKNILLQPASVRSISMVNILTTVFGEIPTNLAERLSPLTTGKSMHHISKNFAAALLSANFSRNNLESLNYESNSITVLTFVAQNDVAKVNAHRDAEQVSKNEREFDFIDSHRKAIKTTIEGLGKIHSMDCIVKICANICCVITAIIDIRAGNPIPLLYSTCIKTIEVTKHPDFMKWHAEVSNKVPQLPYIFLNMLHKVLSQLANFSTNSVNNNLIEHGDNGSQLKADLVIKIVKFVTRFFASIDNHIMEGTVPDSVPTFTPRDANPKILSAVVAPIDDAAPSKVKSDASPPGTPARERNAKKQKVKPAPGATDFTKAGLFRCKEGTPIGELFPNDLEKKLCSFFSFHDKKCTKPNQACDFQHIGKWDKIPPGDQTKILEHCHSAQGKIVWLDAATFTKHKVAVPEKYAYLLGDSNGPKSA